MLASLLGAVGAPARDGSSNALTPGVLAAARSDVDLAYGGPRPASGIKKLNVVEHPALLLADAVLNHSTSQSKTATRVFQEFKEALRTDPLLQPRMLLMHDCVDRDRSVQNTVQLLKLNGVPAWPWQCASNVEDYPAAELLKEDGKCMTLRNDFFGGAEHVAVVAAARAVANQSALVFKSDPSELTEEVALVLREMGTKVASITRDNTLEHVMCRVLSCTEDFEMGHTAANEPPPADWEKACVGSCCVDEETVGGSNGVQVWFNASGLPAHLAEHTYDKTRLTKMLVDRGWITDGWNVFGSNYLYPKPKTEESTKQSMLTWVMLMQALGVLNVTDATVSNYLASKAVKRQLRHKAELNNMDSVVRSLRDAGSPYKEMLFGVVGDEETLAPVLACNSFEPSDLYKGRRDGCVFRQQGDLGAGYYPTALASGGGANPMSADVGLRAVSNDAASKGQESPWAPLFKDVSKREHANNKIKLAKEHGTDEGPCEGDFMPSEEWTGLREGCTFWKDGPMGRGYYRDGLPLKEALANATHSKKVHFPHYNFTSGEMVTGAEGQEQGQEQAAAAEDSAAQAGEYEGPCTEDYEPAKEWIGRREGCTFWKDGPHGQGWYKDSVFSKKWRNQEVMDDVSPSRSGGESGERKISPDGPCEGSFTPAETWTGMREGCAFWPHGPRGSGYYKRDEFTLTQGADTPDDSAAPQAVNAPTPAQAASAEVLGGVISPAQPQEATIAPAAAAAPPQPAGGAAIAPTQPAGGAAIAPTQPAGGAVIAPTQPAGGAVIAPTQPAGGAAIAPTQPADATGVDAQEMGAALAPLDATGVDAQEMGALAPAATGLRRVPTAPVPAAAAVTAPAASNADMAAAIKQMARDTAQSLSRETREAPAGDAGELEQPGGSAAPWPQDSQPVPATVAAAPLRSRPAPAAVAAAPLRSRPAPAAVAAAPLRSQPAPATVASAFSSARERALSYPSGSVISNQDVVTSVLASLTPQP